MTTVPNPKPGRPISSGAVNIPFRNIKRAAMRAPHATLPIHDCSGRNECNHSPCRRLPEQFQLRPPRARRYPFARSAKNHSAQHAQALAALCERLRPVDRSWLAGAVRFRSESGKPLLSLVETRHELQGEGKNFSGRVTIRARSLDHGLARRIEARCKRHSERCIAILALCRRLAIREGDVSFAFQRPRTAEFASSNAQTPGNSETACCIPKCGRGATRGLVDSPGLSGMPNEKAVCFSKGDR